MIWFLSVWKLIVTFIATASIAWMIHSISLTHVENVHKSEMNIQAESLNKQCAKEKAITEGASNAYQKSLSDLNGRYNSLRVQHSRCIAVSNAKTSCGSNASTTEQLHGENGITSEALYGFARDCEQVRLQLIGLQDFIRKSEELND
jgi:hypothetical protein